MLTMRLGLEGELLIKDFEELRLIGYLDIAGVPTNGWGHTGREVYVGQSITQKIAQRWFDEDTADACATVNALNLRRPGTRPLSQKQFDSLVSFQFNTGALSSDRNRVTQAVVAAEDDRVDDEMLRWCKVTDPKTKKKVDSAGLKRRRAAEVALWNEGRVEPCATADEARRATEATAVPVAPPSPTVEAVTHPVVTGGGVTVAASAIAAAADQLRDLVDFSPTIRTVFIVLALAGVALSFYGALRGRSS